jgi:hypothetical protein
LLAPPPLGQQLDIVAGEHGVELRKDKATLAIGRRVRIGVPEIPIVDFSEAQDAARRAPYDASRHPLPMCFVCGPARVEGDGLRIIPRPLPPRPTARSERSRHPGCPFPSWQVRMVPSLASSSGPHWIARLDLRALARSTLPAPRRFFSDV